VCYNYNKGRLFIFYDRNIFMNNLHKVTFLLLVIGGLNWLAFGIWGTDISQWLGGMDSQNAKILYVLVGLSALYELVHHKKNGCKLCK